MDVYGFTDHRALLKAWLKGQPKRGRGIALKLAAHLRVSSVLMSQVLNGTRNLQPHYAFGIAEFMSLNPAETEYFLLLVQRENAGTESYRNHIRRKLEFAREGAAELKSHVARDINLSEEAKAKFYSHWHYSAIRLTTDIPGKQHPHTIAESLGLSITRVNEVLDFLVENKLCKKAGGKFAMAVKSTHLESNSPWIYSRQLHWRQKSLQSMESPSPESVYYTGLMVISEKDKDLIRDRLVQTIREVTEQARNSPSEKLACLNIDWFGLYNEKS